MCVRVEMYVCEWRMYVYESARINYGYIYIYICYTCSVLSNLSYSYKYHLRIRQL